MVIIFQIEYDDRDELNDWAGRYGRNYKNACFRHAVLEAVTHGRAVTVTVSPEAVPPYCDYCGEEGRG